MGLPKGHGKWVGVQSPDIGDARIGAHDVTKGMNVFEKMMLKSGEEYALNSPRPPKEPLPPADAGQDHEA